MIQTLEGSAPQLSPRTSPSRAWRVTLLDRYMTASLLRPAAVCFAVTLTMMMLERAIRLINQISISGGDVGYFFPLMAAELPYYIGLGLPASFFIAMFIVIIRMDEGSEIEAMLANGRSLAGIATPLVGMGCILGVVALVVFGFLEPYGHYQFRRIQTSAVQAGWSGRLQAGAFVTAGRDAVLTADATDVTGKRARGVFLSRLAPDGSESLLTAASATLTDREAQGTVNLAIGSGRNLAVRGDGRVQVSDFENVAVDMPRGLATATAPRGTEPREMYLPELLLGRSPARSDFPPGALAAELYARLGRSASLPLLPLLALPLGIASKRGRRTPGLMLAGLTLVCFHHGVEVLRSLAALGKVDPVLGVGGLFACFASFIFWLFLGSLRRPGETPLTGVLDVIGRLFEWIGAGLQKAWSALRPKRRPSAKAVTLQGYVVRQLAIRTGAAAVVIVALLQLFELLGRANEILIRGVGVLGLGYFMLLSAPTMVQQSVGFAMFAGVVMTFTGLARSGEMVAIRAAGVSLRQLVGMLLPVALVVGAANLVVTDQLAPVAERTLQTWLRETAPAGEPLTQLIPRWFRVGNEIVRADAASDRGDRLTGVRIYRRDALGLIRQRVQAAEATRGPDGRWSLSRVETLTISQDRWTRSVSPRQTWAAALSPGDVVELFQPTLQISALDAFRSLHGGPNAKSAGFLLTRLYRLVAEPLTPLVMLLLASPLAMVNTRNARNIGPLLYGVGGGMAYLVADGLLTASGQTSALPATAAAWTAPLLFAIAGLTMLLYVEL